MCEQKWCRPKRQLADWCLVGICKKQNKPIYIQVSYLLASEETIEREFKPLKNIQDNYPKYVITMDDVEMSHDGIIHLNLIDFLMDNEMI